MRYSESITKIALPPDHDLRGRHSPAWSLPTECITKKIVHVLGFTIVGSVVVLVYTNIDSLSFTVRLKANDKRSWKLSQG